MFENFQQWAQGAIGKTEREVVDEIREAGGAANVVERDGQPTPETHLFTWNCARANLVVVNGIVTEIVFG